MTTTHEIHPAIGIARVGTSTQHFLGPEPAMPAPERYRDGEGALLRQAARFRVFECDRDDNGVLLSCREVTPDLGAIEWTVHLVNSKAAGPKFLATGPADSLRNPGPNRDELKIDPGPRTVSARNPAAACDTGTFRQRPVPLGDVRTDESGRLLVVGGFGTSGSVPDTRAIDNFADNEDWFDDVSDGPVRAVVTTADGRTLEAKPAWVIVAPPDFAPGITNFVTMYDVARDVAVQRGWLTVPERPSFSRDVYPILSRPFAYSWVSGRARLGHHSGRWSPSAALWATLGNPAGSAAMRRGLFERLRNPRTLPPSTLRNMPRLHDETNRSGEVLTTTVTQYQILEKWVAGSFVGDWRTDDDPAELIPDALDRVALQACSGGPFFPGIEAGRIMSRRDGKDIYREPYRLDADALRPGQLTEGNAVPWQADFLLCRDDTADPQTGEDKLAWWPAQRPDKVYVDVKAAEEDHEQQPWARGLEDSFAAMVGHWDRLGIVAAKVGSDGEPVYVETERQLAESPAPH